MLGQEIQYLQKRSVGQPPRKLVVRYYDFQYQAGGWGRPRRWWQGGVWQLFPRVVFVVTNMSARLESVVYFYNGRGMAEQWMKEGKYALNWTRLSCCRFVTNEVRLLLFILAYKF